VAGISAQIYRLYQASHWTSQVESEAALPNGTNIVECNKYQATILYLGCQTCNQSYSNKK
jgi:hypothetical protein